MTLQLQRHVSINQQSVVSLQEEPPSNIDNLHQEHENLEKTYTKNQFMTILIELGQEDPMYYCERRQLDEIYSKVIEAKQSLKGTDIADFAQALKQKNKQVFQQQLEHYQQYVSQNTKKNIQTVDSKHFVAELQTSNGSIGFLTDKLYKLSKQSQFVSIKKLGLLLTEVEEKFHNQGVLAFPKMVSIAKNQFEGHQLVFEPLNEEINAQKLQNLKQLILDHLIDSSVANTVERKLQNLNLQVLDLKHIQMPEMLEEITTLKKRVFQLQAQLNQTYDELQDKNTLLVQFKNIQIELAQKQRQTQKQLLHSKISLNEKQDENQQLFCQVKLLQSKLQQRNEQVDQFMSDFTNLREQYESFIKKKEEQDKLRKTQTDKNMFPTLSVKQQLEDAQFKIKKLKDEKIKLLTDIQNNQQNYVVRIEILERELIQARNQVNRATHLRMSGVSRMSKNYQTSKFSQRKSIFSSVMSVMGASTKQGQQNMGNIINKAEAERLQKSKLKQTGDKKSTQVIVLEKDISDAFQMDKKQQAQFAKEVDQNQPVYNFHELGFEELKNILGKQNLSIVMEEVQQQEDASNLMSETIVLRRQVPKKLQSQKKMQKFGIFICSSEIVSKSGSYYKKYIILNEKGFYYLDTKLRLQKSIPYAKIRKIAFTYYNLDQFVISFKRKQSPMKKKIINNDADVIFKCPRTKQLLSYLSQIHMKKILTDQKVKIIIQKEQDLWIKQSTEKDIVLSTCGNMYNPFKINQTLVNYKNKMFYMEISRQALLSRSFITIALVQSFGIYCFQWYEEELPRERNFIQLLPLVKRMKMERDDKSSIVKLVYSQWQSGKTFLLRFKNSREALKFTLVCEKQRQENQKILQNRKKAIQTKFTLSDFNEEIDT